VIANAKADGGGKSVDFKVRWVCGCCCLGFVFVCICVVQVDSNVY
jgi:hypothetical protein